MALQQTIKRNMKGNSLQYRHVALIIETSNEYARGLLRGIRTYIREHQTWSVYLWEHERSSTDLSWLGNWSGDGILARIENAEIAEYVQRSKLPAIDLSAGRLLPHLSCVETNDESIARMGVDHLRERGYKHFAFCGDSRFSWSEQRKQHFMSLVQAFDADCALFDSAHMSENPNNSGHNGMLHWLDQLPKPCGIMSCYDIQGQRLLEACRIGQISVPDEIGIIGVDNDELLCELSYPSLTSIRPNAEQTGYEAAALLDGIMSGEVVEPYLHRIEPVDIVARQSTDILYVDNEILASAIGFIRDNAHQDIHVKDILRIVPVSRRVLESLFRQKLGRTPHEEIFETKMKRARNLLRETDLSISTVAERIGFFNTEYFSVAFKKKEGITPSLYRERSKNHQ